MARGGPSGRGIRRGILLAASAGVVFLASAIGCGRGDKKPGSIDEATPHAPPTFAGAPACDACHKAEAAAWRISDHARAMEKATPAGVLGNFHDARFTRHGVTSTFTTRDGKFSVRTDGPDGKPADFEIAYTFGVDPLQQYLIPHPGGRYQALGIAWDARPKGEGGQRWLDLHPEEKLAPPDPLHWTGREQNWNYQCAECHSTDLRKNYDLAKDAYDTKWSEIDVSCEACHGPGSGHVAWALARKEGAVTSYKDAKGLDTKLARAEGSWTIRDRKRGIAEWTGAPRTSAELDACARCHARRRPIVDPYPYGRPFLDTHAPALLDEGLYHPDGQILGEVYEYGSFVQSRMFQAGVVCSDCHEPHSLALRKDGNALCGRCHLPATFDVPSHHHHGEDSEASRCVSCHMPSRTYMVVDPRRDHSFRVPRPDLSAELGTPNACNDCHKDTSPKWAAEKIVAWHGPTSTSRRPHFGIALDAGRRGLARAQTDLAALATDREQPGIARATALSLLPEYLSPASLSAVQSAINDEDSLVRASAVASLEALPIEQRPRLAGPRLGDPVLLVRLAAARVLGGAPRETLTARWQTDLDRAIQALIASENVAADRPESHVKLSNLYARIGRPADAETELRTALRLDPRFIPALVNLADFYRAEGRETDAEHTLGQALRIAPDNAEALHALGLLRVRQGRRGDAVALLRRASALRPESARFAFVYAVGLDSAGDRAGAIRVLEEAHRRRPADREVLSALVSYERERGNREGALKYAVKLLEQSPEDAQARALVESLREEAAHP